MFGTIPCYHDNIADNNWFYGNNLLNKSSKEHNDLMSVGNFSINTAMLMGLLVGDSVVVGGEAAIVVGHLELWVLFYCCQLYW